ncbi:MAG: hypothetical protein AAF236_00935 [Verrucomicrobiota bacterium]
MDHHPLPLSTHSADDGSMEEIRDLLFGKKNAEVSQRFDALESRLDALTDRFEQKIEARYSSLARTLHDENAALRSQIESLASNLQAETNDRQAESHSLSDQLNRLRIANEDSQRRSDQMMHDLHQSMLRHIAEEKAALQNDLLNRSNALDERIDRGLAELEASATPRAELSDLLLDISERIRPLPTPENPESLLEVTSGDLSDLRSDLPNEVELSG